MNRKRFLKSCGIYAAAAFIPFNKSELIGKSYSNPDQIDWLNVEHTFDEYNCVVKCPAIKEKIKIIHISDSHLSILENGKLEYPEFTSRMDSAYKNSKHYITGKEGSPQKYFEEILEEAKKKNAELILLTGDIVNNPTVTNINYVKTKLDETGIEYIYTAGNHDWHFEGMDGKLKDLHFEWSRKRLSPLYNGDNPFYSSRIIKGVNFVSIDNSTYQIEKEQVDFFKEQTEKKYPMVLCMHIPIYQPSDLKREIVETMGDPRWGAEHDAYFKDEKRERWPESGNQTTTDEFLIEILSCRNLLAIFAGHDHSAKQNRISVSAYQYLVKAANTGAYRYIELKNSI